MGKTAIGRRTLQPVRRNSRLVGSCEAGLWQPTDKRTMKLALQAAERFDRAHKAKGRRNGPLGHVGLEVLRALWSCIRFRDGCLCPSIEFLMKRCRRSKGAVVGALKRLRAAGFLAWVRRLEYTDGPPGVRGPQVKQATNAYALATPAAALQLVGRTIVPADAITAIRERAAFVAECERAAFDDSKLGRLLGRWAKRFDPIASLPGAMNPAQGVS